LNFLSGNHELPGIILTIPEKEGQNGSPSGKMKKMKGNSIIAGILFIFLAISACGTKPAGGKKPNISPTGATVQPTGVQQPSEAAAQVSPSVTAPRITIREAVVQDMADLVFEDYPPSALLSHVGGHIAFSTPQEADSMLLILESIQKAWLDYYLNRLENSINTDPRADQAWIDELTQNGFRLTEASHGKTPVIDYGIYRKWEGMLSGWFRDYLAIIQAETDSPAVKGGKLSIPKDELEKRLLITSWYIEQYPESVRVNQVLSLYDTYLYSYLYGYDNEPVINFSTGQISMEYYNRYLEFVKKNAEAKVSGIIAEYASVIEKGSFMLTAELEKYLENVFSSLEDHRIVVRNDIGRQILMERMGRLLPDRTGFTWKCFGSGEYEHTAVLAGIHTEDGNPVYVVTGLAGDPSGGENPDVPKDIELEYRIENNVLYQIKSAPAMMDSDFDELEIIRYPFVVGHSWYQYPEDGGINNASVHTEIISVTHENGESLFEVEYTDPSMELYEKRLLQAGKGTIAFAKLYSDGENEPFEIGYFIDEANTGYSGYNPDVN
jgi:hypothetical protein